MRLAEQIGEIGKKPEEKQVLISLGEAYSIWATLTARYDSMITTKTLLQFVKDKDLEIIIKRGLKVLENQVEVLEDLSKEYAIALPPRPPEDCTVTVDINTVTDQFVYREIYHGMANLMFKHLSNYQRAQSSTLREKFKVLLGEEMDLFDNFYEYGKAKTYLYEEPTFRP
jgi:hypothetical protein